MSTELGDWLALLHTPGLGPRRIARLLERFGSPAAALQADARDWALADVPGGPCRGSDREPLERGIEADLAWLEADPRHSILTRQDPRYPPLLAELPDPPPALYLVGDPELLRRPQIAVVGARGATPQGLRHAERFATALAAAGLAVTSGLARGIDGAAHRGALAAENGRTVAVIATGPDRVYPPQHRRLAHRIADHGLLVSLWPVGTAASPRHFPQRNRVISGLALGTLVVEAALRSGSLITARLAAEQGRSVYAIPGSILNPVSRGCHRLIRDGAQLVDSPDDILEDLADWLGIPADAPVQAPPMADGATLDPEQERVLEQMGFDPVALDDLLQRTGLTVDTLSSMLVLLELNGRVAALSHGRYQRLDAGPPET
ncbi:Rossmann fold nucleotide-binding protein Smf possibly involved in DNA uptake [Thioalkalivibrio nitratireducens DSM 14787]|uniref:Rossmann fold nucleotide-binding protein Smf possibly involved in DNA uptake n=1 Tax=Thioalkalivibrio nitratireducens (strain DSM 14787 / UNIQEM 213 / ALEN2) TaxID=1255043 RepID=L0DT06_THIND|nr:DNA-processing protein DprA [Thioalkalivibrio nitratireducens]AGA32120.1 Rossmann fold nucleotide-binding protein Smf possibly involved in DNA uptake [Thioalkalivibrio nitratireducens DSM 14787]